VEHEDNREPIIVQQSKSLLIKILNNYTLLEKHPLVFGRTHTLACIYAQLFRKKSFSLVSTQNFYSKFATAIARTRLIVNIVGTFFAMLWFAPFGPGVPTKPAPTACD